MLCIMRVFASRMGRRRSRLLTDPEWFDESSEHVNDLRHRLMRHHSQGIAECVRRFGRLLTLSNGRQVPMKKIAERHIVEDLGFVPAVADWVRSLKLQPWMMRPKRTRVVI